MPIISGLGAAGASIIGGEISSAGQAAANANNYNMMIQNEQWQESMSDTAMQRRVADMSKAGLNPILAAGGPGASVGSVSPTPMQNTGSGMAAGISSAGSALQSIAPMMADIKLKNAQATQAQATAEQTAGAGTDELKARTALENASSNYQAGALTAKTQAETQLNATMTQEAYSRMDKISAEIGAIGHANNLADANAALSRASALVQGLNAKQIALLMPDIADQLKTNIQAAKLGLPKAQAYADFYNSAVGKFAPAVEFGLNSADKLTGSIANLVPGAGLLRNILGGGSRAPTFDQSLH